MNELEKALAEVRREIRVRESVYPRLVMLGKLSQLEADRRMLAMVSAANWLQTLLCKQQRQQPTTGIVV